MTNLKHGSAVVLLASCAFGLGGCMGPNLPFAITPGSFPPGTTAVLSVEGSLTGAASQWQGTGFLGYHMECLAAPDRDGHEAFTTDSPGHFKLNKPLSKSDLAPGMCFGQKIWIEIAGKTVQGEILTSGFGGDTETRNGKTTSISQVIVGASFDAPAGTLSELLPLEGAKATQAAMAVLEGHGRGINGQPGESTSASGRLDDALALEEEAPALSTRAL